MLDILDPRIRAMLASAVRGGPNDTLGVDPRGDYSSETRPNFEGTGWPNQGRVEPQGPQDMISSPQRIRVSNALSGGGGTNQLAGGSSLLDQLKSNEGDATLAPAAKKKPPAASPVGVGTGTGEKSAAVREMVKAGEMDPTTANSIIAALDDPYSDASRIAAAIGFLNDYPRLRKDIREHDVTSWPNYIQGRWLGVNEPGDWYNQVTEGLDAILRTRTGATISQGTESGGGTLSYERRYMPSFWSGPEDATRKVDSLARALKRAVKSADRGRGFLDAFRDENPGIDTVVPEYSWSPPPLELITPEELKQMSPDQLKKVWEDSQDKFDMDYFAKKYAKPPKQP